MYFQTSVFSLTCVTVSNLVLLGQTVPA